MCILVVEDEPLILMIAVEELAEAGFVVRGAENGDRAAALIEDPRVEFHLLVTDIHMPGSLDGIAVGRRMRESWPEVPIIYTTGRPDVLQAMGPLGGREALLPKPYTPSALLALVGQLLAPPGDGSAA